MMNLLKRTLLAAIVCCAWPSQLSAQAIEDQGLRTLLADNGSFSNWLEEQNYRHNRAVDLALQNDVLHEEVRNFAIALALKGVTISGTGTVLGVPQEEFVEKTASALVQEMQRSIKAWDEGFSKLDAFKATTDVVEIFLEAKYPGISLPLSVAKIASAFSAAYIYHRFLEEIPTYRDPKYADSLSASASIGMLDATDAQQMYGTFGLVPGGVVFEGEGRGWSDFRSVRHYESINAFVIDGLYIYPSPVSQDELVTIFASIDQQEELGFAKGPEERVIFGSLPDGSRVVNIMTLLDDFYFGIIFAKRAWSEHYRMAGGFEPLQASESIGPVANVMSFVSSGFVVEDQLIRSDHLEMVIHLIPLKAGRNGDYVVNDRLLGIESLPEAYRVNATHLVDHFDYYLRERLLRAAFAYAEVADFGRFLRRRGVDLTTVLDMPFQRPAD